MDRKLSPENQRIFDKYTVNFVRRLPKAKAMEMFQNDFGLSHEMADFMFCAFVAEGSQVLTANDFNNFCTCFGKDCNEYLATYKQLEAKGNGTADISGLFDFLKTLKTGCGEHPSDETLERYIMAVAGEERTVDINKFAKLVKRIKMTRSSEKQHQQEPHFVQNKSMKHL